MISVSEEMNHDLLKATAEENCKETEKEAEPYVPRPMYQRVLALILAIIVIIGVILFYYNFFVKHG